MPDPVAAAAAIPDLYERTAAAWLAARGDVLAEGRWLDLRRRHESTPATS